MCWRSAALKRATGLGTDGTAVACGRGIAVVLGREVGVTTGRALGPVLGAGAVTPAPTGSFIAVGGGLAVVRGTPEHAVNPSSNASSSSRTIRPDQSMATRLVPPGDDVCAVCRAGQNNPRALAGTVNSQPRMKQV
jgi:hypothetical protein